MKSYLFLFFGWLPMLLAIQPPVKPLSGNPVKPSTPAQEKFKLMPDDTLGVLFFDDFSEKLSSQWAGDLASFTLVDQRLTLTTQAAPPVFLSTATNRMLNTCWEAGIQVQGALTATNYVRLYLASTTHSLHDPKQGYHLQIDGKQQTHIYSLWRQNGRTRSLILQSRPFPNQGNAFRARVRVTCSPTGNWQILADENDRGKFEVVTDPNGIPTVKDITYTAAAYAGYAINFSPARWADFQLDYFLIKPLDPTSDGATTQTIQPGDILINEILSNPKPDGVDFVELYNYSNKTIDLQQLHIASVNSKGLVGSRRKVSERSVPMPPNDYKVLTTDPTLLQRHYPNGAASTFVEMPALPNFNNETGGVVIYSNNLTLDSLFYTPEMQAPFIVTPKGISLERQYFSTPTNQPGNFRSAATVGGGATPGYPNSQSKSAAEQYGFFLNSKTFSPDNDGFEDELEISYFLPDPGFMVNIEIYDTGGQLVKKLQRNQSLGTQGYITWDGLSDSGQHLPIGIYIAAIEIYHPQGETKMYRLSFVLAAKL